MKLSKTIKSFKNIKIDEIRKQKFDLGLFACGYEIRSTYLLSQKLQITKKICFAFKSTNGKVYLDNLHKFKIDSCDIHQISKKSFEKIINPLNLWLKSLENDSQEGKSYKILIDYSSMTRYWYAVLINYFKYTFPYPVKIYFCYSESFYEPVLLENQEIQIESLDFIAHIAYPEKPVALIICLGDQEIQSAGLKEYYDADLVYYYYLDNEHSKKILKINSKVIDDNYLFKFNNENLSILRHDLDKLCKRLSDNYRIIIAPCGPKTFTIISILLSSFTNQVDVWRIGLISSNEELQKAKPNGNIIINELDLILGLNNSSTE